MADKHGLNDVRELKLGASFTNNKASQYHTIKYDFKPASVDVNKMATVDVGTNNQVTVTVPHLDGAGVPHTVFRGSQRPYTKECVLIIDRVTGEITLEKLSSNIQVKKTRQESTARPRPLTPVTTDFTNTTQRSTSRTRVATNRRANTHASNAPGPGAPAASNSLPRYGAGAGGPGAGPGGAGGAVQRTPPNMVRSPHRVKTSPPQAPSWSSGGNSTLASLPMIGFDDSGPSAPAPHPAHPAHHPAPSQNGYPPAAPARGPLLSDKPAYDRNNHAERSHNHVERTVERTHVDRSHSMPQMPTIAGVAAQQSADASSSSSSSESGSDSGSDSDSDDNDSTAARQDRTNGNPALPTDVLNDDLCLSESGSDSD